MSWADWAWGGVRGIEPRGAGSCSRRARVRTRRAAGAVAEGRKELHEVTWEGPGGQDAGGSAQEAPDVITGQGG